MTAGVPPAGPVADGDALQSLELRLSETRAELDKLVEKLGDEKPWYRTISGAISVAAFVLSIISGVYSCQRDIDQERQQARASLNTLSQRLLTLPRENFELAQKYKGDGNAQSTLSSLLNAENITMVNTMKELVARFPDIVTDNDKFVLASSLVNSTRIPEAVSIYNDLAQTASDPNVAVAADRNLGFYFLANGQPDIGRKYFENAVGIFEGKFKSEDQYMKASSNIYTYLMWAKSEIWTRNCNEAQGVLGRAMSLAAEIRLPPDAPMLLMASEIERDVQRCREGLPVAPPPPQLQ
ncbi:MAG: hypothetical protein IPK78_21160 [Rhodospirillales bacterium]|nr:hypothetical protein [Rhodospirillales bacterium]